MTTVDQSTDVERIAERLDAAEGAVRDLDAPARAAAEELAEALKSLTTSTLTTLVRRLRDDERGRELLFELVDDPVVRMGLLVHGIIRPDPMTLATQALDRVRPTLHSHGGDVELSHLEEQIAYVRLTGACNGCSMSSVTLRNLVEETLRAAIPSLTAVEVLPNEPTPTVIPIESIRVRPAGGDEVAAREAELESAGWCRALRRSGRRREADAALQQAGELFAQMGAAVYVRRCERERRAGGVDVERGSRQELTPQEKSVAALVAAGNTNAVVADELFLSVKTVEYHLTRIYAKLGVRGRAELAAVYAG